MTDSVFSKWSTVNAIKKCVDAKGELHTNKHTADNLIALAVFDQRMIAEQRTLIEDLRAIINRLRRGPA